MAHYDPKKNRMYFTPTELVKMARHILNCIENEDSEHLLHVELDINKTETAVEFLVDERVIEIPLVKPEYAPPKGIKY